MESIYTLFRVASGLSPLAIIGLLIGLLYLFIYRQHPLVTSINGNIQEMRGNDLHPLGDILETLQRMETSQEKNFALILERLRQ